MSNITNAVLSSAPEWFTHPWGAEDWREAPLPQPQQAFCRACGEVTDQVMTTDYECEPCLLSLVE
jgi:hypothetical protein